MSRATLGGRVAACARAGGSAGSVVKSLILGLPTPREARARNTTPTPSATAPPLPRPRPRAAWMTLVTPTTTPVSPPSAKSTKATSPRTTPSQASAGPITKSTPAITPKAFRRPARDVPSSIAPPSSDGLLVDALLVPGPFPLAQRVLLHLAGRGLRQRAEGDRPRALEVREHRAAVGDDVGLRRRPSLLEHDERLRHLAPLRVRHGDHRHLEHVGVACDRLLDLDGRDVLAARDDDVLLAVAQLDVAVGVHDGHVAGVEPAAAESLGGGGGIVEVAGHDVIAPHHHFSQRLGVRRHVAHLLVDDAELAGDQVGHPPAGPQAWARLRGGPAPPPVPGAPGVRAVGLGEAVDVADLRADRFPLREQRGRRRREIGRAHV